MPLKRTYLLLPVIALGLSIALLTGLPYAVRYTLQSWILQHGGERVTIHDVDLNPFSGRLALKGMHIELADKTILHSGNIDIDLDWWPLLQKRIVLRSVTSDGLQISISENLPGFPITAGITLPQTQQRMTENNARWKVGIEALRLSDMRIDLRQTKFKARLDIEQLTLTELAGWTPGIPATIRLVAHINDAPLHFTGEIRPFGGQQHYSGHLMTKEFALPLLDNVLTGTISKLDGTLSIDSDISFSHMRNGNFHLEQNGNIILRQAAFTTAQISGKYHRLSWHGRLSAETATAASITTRMEGSLQGERLKTQLHGPCPAHPSDPASDKKCGANSGLIIRQQSVDLAGKIAIDPLKSDLLTAAADVSMIKLNITAEQGTYELLDIDELTLQDINASAPDRVKIAQLIATRMTLARHPGTDAKTTPSGTALLTADSVHFDRFALRGKRLSVDTISIAAPQAALYRDTRGQWNTARLVEVLNRLASTERRMMADGQRSRRSIRIGHIMTVNPGTLSLFDADVAPPFTMPLLFEQLDIRKLDSTRKDQPSPFLTAGKLGNYGTFNMTGELYPFSDKLMATLAANVAGLELYPFSPYSAQALGFRLHSGILNADVDISATQTRLDGMVILVLRQLELTPLDNGQANKLESALSMPLDVALNTLRDDHNTIRLKLPISGHPDAPDFDLRDTIRQALSSGLKKGAYSYLTLTLQPYGALITMARLAGEQVNKLRLKPIEFTPGSSLLSATAIDYLGRVATVLTERPQLTIKLCGIAVTSDRSANNESAPSDAQMRRLAEQRALSVKSYLIDQHRIDGNQLVTCRPEIDAPGDDKPRLDLLI